MREMGVHGVRQGRFVVAPRTDPAAVLPEGQVDRDLSTTTPNQLWSWTSRASPRGPGSCTSHSPSTPTDGELRLTLC